MSNKPNMVKEAKEFAIQEWDRIAQVQIRRGNYVRGFGAWSAKQLAKAHSESWLGLGIDVASLGTGALLTKGLKGISSLEVLSRARAAAAGAKYLQGATKVANVVVKGANAEKIIAKSAVSVPKLVGASRLSMTAGKAMPGAVKASIAWGSRTHPVGIVRRVGKFISRGVTHKAPPSPKQRTAAAAGATRVNKTSATVSPRKIAKSIAPKQAIRQPPKVQRPAPLHRSAATRPVHVHRPIHRR